MVITIFPKNNYLKKEMLNVFILLNSLFTSVYSWIIHFVFKENYVDARNEHDSVTKLKIMMKQRFANLHFKIQYF